MTLPSDIRSRSIDAPAYFSVAVLATVIMSAAIWLLTSQVIHTPAAADVAQRFGLRPAMVHIVKPEPIEKATFLVSAIFGALAFTAAGYSSAKTPMTRLPRAFRIALSLCVPIAALCAGIWISQIERGSLLSSLPNIFQSTLADSPFACLAAAAALSPVVLLCGWLSAGQRSSYLGLCAFLIPLAVLSRLVLLSDFDPYITTNHYEVFVYPLIQDWLGEGIHLSQKSQYGMYPIFLRPIWMLTGGPTTRAVSAVMAILLFLSNTSLLAFMDRHTRSRITGLAFGLSAILFSMLSFPFWPGDAYFQFFPVRLVFPALSMLIICLGPTSLCATAAAYTAAAFGLLWNLESGIVAMLMLATYCVAVEPHTTSRRFLMSVVKHAALLCTAIAVAVACINAYYFLRFQQFFNPFKLLLMVQAFSSGIGAAPMPLHGAWVIHLFVYASALFVGARTLTQQPMIRERQRAAALLATGVMGLLWFQYYQGRSMSLPLTFVTFPAIMCVGLMLDQAISRYSRNDHMVSCMLATLIAAPLTAVLFVWVGNNPVPHRGIRYLADDHLAWPNNSRPALIDRIFNENRIDAEDRCVVVAMYSHLANLKLGQPGAIYAAGITQMWFDTEVKDLQVALQDGHTRVVVFDDTRGIEQEPTIRDALSTHFDPYPDAVGCSTCVLPNMHIYIRKGTRGSRDGGDGPQPLSITGTATQSSTFVDAIAARAVDGNRDGTFNAASTSHTGLDTTPWWQVDVGVSGVIDGVRVWNRTDCCSDRLSNFWVFVSDTPFGTDVSLEELVASPNVSKVFCSDVPCPSATMRLPFGSRGRYVRVQLQDTGHLCIAEVELFDKLD